MGPRGATACMVVALTTAGVAGCSSGSQPRTQTPSTSATQSRTASPTASIDPKAQPAVDAYMAYAAAVAEAKRDPKAFVAGTKSAADFRPYAVDPIKGQEIAYVMSLASQQVAFRGAAPTPRIAVASVDLAAKPYGRVVLTDCQKAGTGWEEYVVKTGKSVPTVNGEVPPPYKLTVTVLYVDGRWGTSSISADKSRTCTA